MFANSKNLVSIKRSVYLVALLLVVAGNSVVTQAEETFLIIDNDNVGYTSVGAWTNWGTGYLGDLDFKAGGNGSAYVNWEVEVPAGTYRVLTTWLEFSGRATNAPYSIYDGNTLLKTVEVNQVIAEVDYPAHGTVWDELSVVEITSGTLRIELSDNANGYVIADAILIEQVEEEEIEPEEDVSTVPVESFEDTILDDDDVGYSSIGAWNNWTQAGYLGDVDYKSAGNGSAKALWEINNIPSGTYRVLATWLPYSGRATNAPYTIFDGTTEITTIEVNQVATMKDYTAHGAVWDILATVTITSGRLAVELSDDANGYVIADGILVERVVPNQ